MSEIIEEKLDKYYKKLFTTNVGSHLWGMDTPESDIDIWTCYSAPSISFLIGNQHVHSHHSGSSNPGELDSVSHEVGKIVKQLLMNNFNFIVGVMSPLIIKDWEELPLLRKLTEYNLSKLCYDSINGLVVHNFKKYILSEKDNTVKRRQTIMRTLFFGLNLFDTGKIKFSSVKEGESYKYNEIPYYIDVLRESCINSNLPERPEYKEEMYEWLLYTRLKNLRNEIGDDYNFRISDDV